VVRSRTIPLHLRICDGFRGSPAFPPSTLTQNRAYAKFIKEKWATHPYFSSPGKEITAAIVFPMLHCQCNSVHLMVTEKTAFVKVN
jgi:hypothetical protein